MAFNNTNTHPQMPGAFGDGERDEFGLTEDDYEQMMNEVTGMLSCSSKRC